MDKDQCPMLASFLSTAFPTPPSQLHTCRHTHTHTHAHMHMHTCCVSADLTAVILRRRSVTGPVYMCRRQLKHLFSLSLFLSLSFSLSPSLHQWEEEVVRKRGRGGAPGRVRRREERRSEERGAMIASEERRQEQVRREKM